MPQKKLKTHLNKLDGFLEIHGEYFPPKTISIWVADYNNQTEKKIKKMMEEGEVYPNKDGEYLLQCIEIKPMRQGEIIIFETHKSYNDIISWIQREHRYHFPTITKYSWGYIEVHINECDRYRIRSGRENNATE